MVPKPQEHVYIAIDLKSFYASCECAERGIDPLTANLVVADGSRTDKTICLAVSPSLKELGIPGRARLFEVKQRLDRLNALRLGRIPGRQFSGSSWNAAELARDPSLKIDFITAVPQMSHYIRKSTEVYEIYLRYAAPEDIHVYSIDEVFIYAAPYLRSSGMTPRQFASAMIHDVLSDLGITATAGIGPNLYLAKVAMDIMAKHVPADAEGVRIAELDEMTYRQKLWHHRPLRDFWRVGPGIARKLEGIGLFTMGDVARCSLHEEDLLYNMFGVNAELLIDHAWGWEPVTIRDIKAYHPENRSIGSGQVLHIPYDNEKARLIVWEMADQLSLDLTEKGLETNQIVLTIGYDRSGLSDSSVHYQGPVTTDHYGRRIPKSSRGTENLEQYSSLSRAITGAAMRLYDRISVPELPVRRIYLTACGVLSRPEAEAENQKASSEVQLDLFSRIPAPGGDTSGEQNEDQSGNQKEEEIQKTLLAIKEKFGKNAVVKGRNLEKGSTAISRNRQIGGHKA